MLSAPCSNIFSAEEFIALGGNRSDEHQWESAFFPEMKLVLLNIFPSEVFFFAVHSEAPFFVNDNFVII